MYEITRMQKEPTKQPVSAHIKRILNPRWAWFFDVGRESKPT
jgi:hypothetical protein